MLTPDFERFVSDIRRHMSKHDDTMDLNYDGSAVSFIMKMLAYDSTNQGYYNTMMFNELHSSAEMRENIGTLIQFMTYTPRSNTGARGVVNVTVTPFDPATAPTTLTLTRRHQFSAVVDDQVLAVSPVTNYTAPLIDGSYVFESVEMIQGTRKLHSFSVIGSAVTPFIIPHEDVDMGTIKVFVRQSESDDTMVEFAPYQDAYDLGIDKDLYYTSLNRHNRYQISFGDGTLSNSLAHGNIVIAEYMTTDGGSAGNFITAVNPTSSIDGYTNIQVDVISSFTGGRVAETADEIRQNATKHAWTGGTIMNPDDLRQFVVDRWDEVVDATAWDGKDHTPPKGGSMFIAVKGSDASLVSPSVKQSIIEEAGRRSASPITIHVRDADVLYIDVVSDVRYDPSRTLQDQYSVKGKVIRAITDFSSNDLEAMNVDFDFSSLSESINDADGSIKGNVSDVTYRKPFYPSINFDGTYIIKFNKHIAKERVLITGFTTIDSVGEDVEVYDDGKGVLIKRVYDPLTGKFVDRGDVGSVDYTSGTITLVHFNPSIINNPDGAVYVSCKADGVDRDLINQVGVYLQIGTIDVNMKV